MTRRSLSEKRRLCRLLNVAKDADSWCDPRFHRWLCLATNAAKTLRSIRKLPGECCCSRYDQKRKCWICVPKKEEKVELTVEVSKPGLRDFSTLTLRLFPAPICTCSLVMVLFRKTWSCHPYRFPCFYNITSRLC